MANVVSRFNYGKTKLKIFISSSFVLRISLVPSKDSIAFLCLVGET
jgi:hypothetical protein